MKKAGIIFSSILASLFISGQAQSQSMYQKVIGGTAGDELANYSQLTADSGQIIVGYTDGFGSGSNDVYLVKTDASGAIEWSKTYGGSGSDIGYGVAATSDGGYIVVGETNSSGAGSQDIFLIKTDALGDTTWTKTYGGSLVDIAYSVRETFDGGYVMVGYTGSFGTGAEDVYVIKTDAMGDTLWTKTYGSGGFDYAYSIEQTADTGYILVGETYMVGGGDALLIKTDSMGDTTWTRTYGGSGFDAGWEVSETMDGGYIFGGWTSSFGSGGFDIYLVKVDATGDTLWTRAYGGTLDDVGLSVSETADTTYLVAGYTFSFGTVNGDAYGIGVDAMGTVLWSMAYGGVSGDAAYSIEMSADGGYVLGGYSYSLSAGDADYYLLHADATGSTGSCYETSTATVTTSSAANVGTLSVTSVMNSTVGVNGTTVTAPASVSRAEFAISITASADNACFGDSAGTAISLAVGGTAPYTYLWDDLYAQSTASADSLIGGNYQVMVTDGLGCLDSATVFVIEPAIFTAVLSDSMDVNCFGDSSGFAAATPTGGTLPYNYLWSDVDAQTDSMASGLYGGTFNVSVSEANGCPGVILTVTLYEPSSALTLPTSNVQATCGVNNGTATVSPTGGSAPYTYSWNTSPVQTDSTATGLALGTYTATVIDSLGCSGTATVNITNPGAPTVSITDSMNILCNGDSTGYATITPTGGTPPYTYLWDDDGAQTDSMAVGLPMGTYTVNVSDATGCGVVATVALTEPAALSLSTITDTLSCFGDANGTATVTATGGIGSFTYAWNDPLAQSTASADSLSGGAHQVMVTDGNGCIDSASITIGEPAEIALIISDSNHVACNGDGDGSATVSATGGVGPLTYLWDDPSSQTTTVMTGVDGGTYMCMVTDSTGCSNSITFVVNEPAAMILSVSSTLNVACNTDQAATATATASGGNGTLTYLWNDAGAQNTAVATNLPNGNYTVVVTDGAGCAITDSVTFGIIVTLTSSAAPICGGICDGSATISSVGGLGTLTYSWDDANTQSTASVTSLCGGSTYTGIVTDTSGCQDSATVTFPSVSAMNVTLNVTDINCFGNTNGAATVFVNGGQPPYTYWWPSLGSSSAFINSLIAGNYDVMITDGGGCSILETASVTEPAAALSSSISVTSTSCAGSSDGSADLTVNGGTTPYKFDWQGSASEDTSGLVVGSYPVDITDANGCNLSDTATISEPASVSLSGGSSSDTGGGTGQAWVTVTGGTSPYTYTWNDGLSQTTDTASGLVPGEYLIVVLDKKGCSMSLEIAVGDASVGVFQTSYEGSGDDLARDMDLLSNGGHIIAGITESFGSGGSDMFLLNTDENGNYNWAKAYGGAADDGANAVLQTSDGGYVMAGYTSSFGAGGSDMYVVKTDASGVIEWTQTYGGTFDEIAYSIAETTGGYVIAGGTNSFGSGSTDVYVVSIDDNGVINWTKTYGGGGYDYGYDLKETTDGGLIIAGYTYSFGAGGSDAYLIKTDANGVSSWTKVMGGDGEDAAWAVIETTAGYALTGYTESFGSGLQDVYFVLTDATGTPTLTRALGGSDLDYGNDLTATADGGFAITGYSRSFNNFGDEVYLIKTDGGGDVIWSRTYGGAFGDRAWAIQETSTGELVIAGNSKSFGLSITAGPWEYYLIRTDNDGDSQCNVGPATTEETDTIGSPITIGGIEGSGGSASSASTVETNTTPMADIICFSSTDVQQMHQDNFELSLYPNPNNGQFTLALRLNSNSSPQLITIYNMNGKVIKSEKISGSGKTTLDVDLGDAPTGMYYVQVLSDGVYATKKVIIQ